MDLTKFAPENISEVTVEELQSLTHDQVVALGKMYPNTKYRQPYLVAVPRGKDKEVPVTASWAIVASWVNIGFKNFKILGTYDNYMAEMSKNQAATPQGKPVENLGALKVDLGPVNLEDGSKNQSEETGSEVSDTNDSGADAAKKEAVDDIIPAAPAIGANSLASSPLFVDKAAAKSESKAAASTEAPKNPGPKPKAKTEADGTKK